MILYYDTSVLNNYLRECTGSRSCVELSQTSRKMLTSVKFSPGKAAKKFSGSVEGENVQKVQSILVILDQPCYVAASK